MNEELQASTEVSEPTQEQQQPKTFGQEELDSIVGREKKRAAEKVRKELESSEEYKQYMNWKETNKSEQERLADQLKGMENLKQQNAALNEQLACLKYGVAEQSMSDAIALAKTRVNEETDFATALKAVVEAYPTFKGVQEEVKAPFQLGTKTTPKSADGFTMDQIKGMSKEDIAKNWQQIQKTLNR